MEFIKRLTILLLVTVVMFNGCFLLLYVTGWIGYSNVAELFRLVYTDQNLRIGVGIFAGALLVWNFLLYSMFSINVHRSKIIAFDNPSGRVSVSLTAIEDLVKRLLIKSAEIKDARINMTASRKNLNIRIRLTLASDVNIPGVTSRVQSAVIKKVQDVIGLEEKINVTVYIGKIFPREYRGEKDQSAVDESVTRPSVPYHGFRT